MRNKLTITITDLHGSKHFTVHQIIKKVIVYITVAVLLFFVAAAIVIYFLNNKIEQLETIIADLETKRKASEVFIILFYSAVI
jgi:uncharacterized metal-binding protein